MKKYTLKRILTSLFTLLAILLVLFILMQLMPGSPFNDEKLTPDMRAALYAKYGLDQPIYIQFFRYVGNMLRGDLGVSYNISKNTPISQLIQSRLPISIRWAAWRSRWVPSQVWCWASCRFEAGYRGGLHRHHHLGHRRIGAVLCVRAGAELHLRL